jgi:hypothetical protein
MIPMGFKTPNKLISIFPLRKRFMAIMISSLALTVSLASGSNLPEAPAPETANKSLNSPTVNTASNTVTPEAQPKPSSMPSSVSSLMSVPPAGSTSSAQAPSDQSTPAVFEVKDLTPEDVRLLPRNNPFRSLLDPIPTTSDSATMTKDGKPIVSAPPPPADPYGGIGLNGILFREKQSLAILTLGGQSKIVRVGDVLDSISAPGTLITVSAIGHNAVTLTNSNAKKMPKEMAQHMLVVPSLIGYQAVGKTGTALSMTSPQPPAALLNTMPASASGIANPASIPEPNQVEGRVRDAIQDMNTAK